MIYENSGSTFRCKGANYDLLNEVEQCEENSIKELFSTGTQSLANPLLHMFENYLYIFGISVEYILALWRICPFLQQTHTNPCVTKT